MGSKSKGWLDGLGGNLFFLLVAGGIGYCRYNGIQIPVLDDLIQKVYTNVLGAKYGGGGGAPPRDDAASTLANARAGKPMAVEELVDQLNQFCRRGGCTKE